ncbi:hypothetical protein Ocin01_16725 [Orchesella cincta]|uniref:Uncharacterized protein n=1 Tax=Orchesella cincta TaxID=48709 RepID=A0A1D2MAE2_ORCCI|nr:hypothetical protein Ocin01_16725 [Orchesella cincta]
MTNSFDYCFGIREPRYPCLTLRLTIIFCVFIVFMCIHWRSYSKSRVIEVNDGSWDVSDVNDVSNCYEFKYNQDTYVSECYKRYGSGNYVYLGLSMFFLVLAGLILIIMFKDFYTRFQQSRLETQGRHEWTLERPTVAISTVGGNNSMNNVTSGNPSAPPSHIIAYAPSATVAEVDAPPSYNECVINIRNRD